MATDRERRLVDDAIDWLAEYEARIAVGGAQSEAENNLARAVRAVLAERKVVPPGVRVIRETVDGPLLAEPYVAKADS